MRLAQSQIFAEDCATCDTKEGMLDRIDRDILLTGDLSEEQQARLMADRCPIHRRLVSELQISTRLAPVGASAIQESSTT
jgi:putative redox protein